VVKRACGLLWRLAVLAAVLWVVREVLKRWVDGPDPEPSNIAWPQVTEETAGQSTARAQATSPAQPAVESDRGPISVSTPTGSALGPATWVEPNEAGGAPETHPVKAKVKSRIYHLPGTAAYNRTRPDRCYVSAEAAEADGFVRSKR
jgi:hypothetical protein